MSHITLTYYCTPIRHCENAAKATFEQHLYNFLTIVAAVDVAVVADIASVAACILSGHCAAAIDSKLITDKVQSRGKLRDCI